MASVRTDKEEDHMNISDEAVEAAARAIRDDDWPTCEDKIHHPVRDYMGNARAALEAAATHMLTRLTNAVINRAYEDGQSAALDRLAAAYDEGLEAGDGLRPRGNPYI